MKLGYVVAAGLIGILTLASGGPVQAKTSGEPAALNAISADGTLAVGADTISPFLTPICGSDLSERRSQTGWTALPTPSPPTCGWLASVVKLPGGRAWAVGYQITKTAKVLTLTEYYNGSKWTIEPSPNPGTSDYLRGVAVTKSGTVWAVGSDTKGSLIFRREGSKWVSVPVSVQADLQSVTVTPGGQVWAAGDVFSDSDFAIHTEIIRLNGSKWQTVPSPSPGQADSSYLTAIAAGPHSALWAVGYYFDPANGAPRTLTMRYASGKWSQVASPSPGTHDDWLYGVAVTSSGGAWAVGGYTGSSCERALAEQYTGAKWQLAQPLNRGACNSENANALYGVTAAGATVYAVGQADISTLAEQRAGGHWKLEKSVN